MGPPIAPCAPSDLQLYGAFPERLLLQLGRHVLFCTACGFWAPYPTASVPVVAAASQFFRVSMRLRRRCLACCCRTPRGNIGSARIRSALALLTPLVVLSRTLITVHCSQVGVVEATVKVARVFVCVSVETGKVSGASAPHRIALRCASCPHSPC